MKTILITGANRGIGLQLTKQYLANQYRVIAICRQPQNAAELQHLATQHKNELQIYALDVSDFNAVYTLAKKLAHEKIDILMNNAGVIGVRSAQLDTIDEKMWLDTFRVNTIAPLVLAHAFSQHVANSEMKIMANMSSVLASISLNHDGGYYPYRATKSALNALTKNLSIEFKSQGITVISLHPGWVQTDMGGHEAPLTVEESVSGIANVLASLTQKDTGTFIAYDGKRLTW